jgi:hypothetical protein
MQYRRDGWASSASDLSESPPTCRSRLSLEQGLAQSVALGVRLLRTIDRLLVCVKLSFGSLIAFIYSKY